MLRVGDVIIQISNEEVQNSDDFEAIMKKQSHKKGIRFNIEIHDGGRFVLVSPEK